MSGKLAADVTAFFIKRRPLLKLVTRLHILLYRLSGGALGGLPLGVPTLLLTTRGRKSGRKSTTPLYWLSEGMAFAVVASYGGSPKDPDWWLNLQAHEGWIEVGPNKFTVRAQAAEPEVRDRLLAAFTRLYPAYAEYQARTDRKIPVVLLHPV